MGWDREARLPGGLDGDEAARVALALDLAARIGARIALQGLADELGRGAALRLFAVHARQAAHARALLALAVPLAEAAQAAQTPVVFLKGAALHLRGLARPEARPSGDVDVLVPEAQAETFAGVLRLRGFRVVDVPCGAHQLAPLVDAQARVVEIHRFLPNLRVPGAGPGRERASFEALDAAGALEALTELPGRAGTLARPLLAAHAVAHGLVQSGRTPHVYSLTRLLADVLDLGLAGDEDLARRAFAWIAEAVSEAEYQGLLALARRLEAADPVLFDEAERGEPRPEALLLRHVLAGALDGDYRRVLRAQAALGGEGRGPRGLLRSAWRAVALSPAQVDALYGRPAGPLGYAWRRLLRPFDLVLRLLQAGAAALRGRSAG